MLVCLRNISTKFGDGFDCLGLEKQFNLYYHMKSSVFFCVCVTKVAIFHGYRLWLLSGYACLLCDS